MTDDKGKEPETSIIDGEFTEAGKEADPPKAAAAGSGRGQRILLWMCAFVIICMAGFIGGLFATPYVERQMAEWGLISSEFEDSKPGAQTLNASALTTRLNDLEITLTTALGRIDTLERRVKGFIEDEDATADRLDRLEENIKIAGTQSNGDINLAPLFARIDRLDSRLQTLENEIGDLGSPTDGQEAAVQTLLDAVETARQDRRRLAEELQTLMRRMAAIEAIDRTGSLRGPQLATDLVLLKRAIEQGTAYSASLDAVRASISHLPQPVVTDAKPMLERLSDYAEDGIPSARMLRREFEAIAPATKRAMRTSDTNGETGEGWLARLKSSLSSIISVRSLDPAEASGIDAILLETEAALETGNAERAYRLIKGLDPRARQPAQAWLVALQKRVEAEAAYNSLMERLGARGEL